MAIRHQSAKKRYLGYVFGTCDKSGETRMPLTWYPRTREYLSPHALKDRKREVTGRRKVKRDEEIKNRWDELNSLSS